MKFETMALPEGIKEEYLIATYYMNSQKEPDLYDWVKLVAADQSAGTWTHVEGESPEVIEKYGAKVISIIPMAGRMHAWPGLRFLPETSHSICR